jgi:hypothetical protein
MSDGAGAGHFVFHYNILLPVGFVHIACPVSNH